MKKRLKQLALLGSIPLLINSSNTISAVNFSAEVLNQFHIIRDVKQPKTLQYISRYGAIAQQTYKLNSNEYSHALRAPQWQIPSFYAVTLFGQNQPFLGEEMVGFGGQFTTLENTSSLAKLIKEARAQGYTRIMPALYQYAELNFIATAFDIENGQLALDCKIEKIPVEGGSDPFVTIPICHLKGTDQVYDININLLYSLNSNLPTIGSTNNRITFDAVTLPGWKPDINNLLSSGEGWQHLLTGVVDWSISSQPIKTYNLDVDWIKLYNFTFKDLRNGINPLFSKKAVRNKMKQLLSCNDINQCGIQLKHMGRPGEPGLLPDSTLLQDALGRTLFTETKLEFDRRTTTTLNRVKRKILANTIDTNSQFIPKANFQQILQQKKGNLSLLIPNKNIKHYRTILDINCIKGKVDNNLRWKSSSSHCSSNPATPKISYHWSGWKNSQKPNFIGEVEKRPKKCLNPIAIQARSAKNKKNHYTLKERLNLSPRTGLQCLNKHQSDKKCEDYEVNWLCMNISIIRPPIDPPIVIDPPRWPPIIEPPIIIDPPRPPEYIY
ncbi:hypothetical protein [Spartinivicinus poritis]|uniref:WxxW domain-containing protein n=1 Tax=Spartinivicinus poritis TaxID=2994640 RepID=A0ABT5UC39_9GAMM|nr:hypothetical protein [Spartinivicinus sp. A2-2]MDE1463755.1 hypothetical protein [Spartinivicinus sp. A2-2]